MPSIALAASPVDVDRAAFKADRASGDRCLLPDARNCRHAQGAAAEGARPWDGLRPTSDKLRETLFNILAPRIAGARVSRRLCRDRRGRHRGAEPRRRGGDIRGAAIGARRRSSPRTSRTAASRPAMLLSALDVARARSVARRGGAGPDGLFDIVLLDPPYDDERDDLGRGARSRRASSLAPGGLVVLEHATPPRPAPDDRRTPRCAVARRWTERRFDAVRFTSAEEFNVSSIAGRLSRVRSIR